MSIYRWVFKPDAGFRVWQLSGKNIGQLAMLKFFFFCQIHIKLRPPITWLSDIMR